MDLLKVFDLLPHGLLTVNLRAYGLSENASDLLASYLSQMFQRLESQISKIKWRLLWNEYLKDPYWILCFSMCL